VHCGRKFYGRKSCGRESCGRKSCGRNSIALKEEKWITRRND
jgi:hypothetical protein